MGMDTSMDTSSTPFGSVAELRAWCVKAPPGTHVDAGWLAEFLAEAKPTHASHSPDPAEPDAPDWRILLWTVPAETPMSAEDVAAAFGKPVQWTYDRVRPTADPRLPHGKAHGCLAFQAGEVRAWWREARETIHGGPMDSPHPSKLKAIS